MKTILALGPYRFVLPSASIARAIVEALDGAQQVEPVIQSNGPARYVAASGARQVGPLYVTQAPDDTVPESDPTPPSTTVSALLDQPPKARRETRRVLALAAACRR